MHVYMYIVGNIALLCRDPQSFISYTYMYLNVHVHVYTCMHMYMATTLYIFDV